VAAGNGAKALIDTPGKSSGFNLVGAIGNGADARVISGSTNLVLAAGDKATASADGLVNLAAAFGSNSKATAIGNLNKALVIGSNSSADAEGGVKSASAGIGLKNIGGNTAITIGNNSHSTAGTVPPAGGVTNNLSDNLKFAIALGNNKTVHNP